MDFYASACNSSSNLTVRVHPLLLSLSSAFDASEKNPDLSTVSENDERALRSNFYTSPSALPPLEIHFSGQNGLSPHSNQNWLCSHIGSWLRRMHSTCRSRQLPGGGQCYPRQFGSSIPCPRRQFITYRQRISEHAQQWEEASTLFFGGCSRQSLKPSRPKDS